jgi:hypothetical protein
MATCNPTPDPCAFCGAPTERKGRTACGAAECQRQRQAAYYRAKYKQPLMPLAEIRALISYDPLSGLFKNVVDRPPRAKADAPAGTVDDLGYIAISLGLRHVTQVAQPVIGPDAVHVVNFSGRPMPGRHDPRQTMGGVNPTAEEQAQPPAPPERQHDRISRCH